MRSIDEQMAILMRGVEFGDEQIRETMARELRERLAEGRPLRVYLGVDPSAPDLHLGHTVPLRKLAQFQELGHEVVFLVGSFTALIGDPSEKEGVRKQQTPQEVRANARSYVEQVHMVLDAEKTIIRYNDEWLSPLSFADIIKLASHFTVQQFLARDNFSKRHAKGDPIWLHEFFYGLMQGYDAVALQTDVQIGGTEQLFNLLAGRKLMEAFDLRPQVCLTFPILVGTDGHLRMSKSTGNYIGISEKPEDIYGKVMSIPDHAMSNYMNLVTRWTPAEIETLESALTEGRLHPRDAKMRLAREIVSIFCDDEAAGQAEAYFKRVFQKRKLPSDMPVFSVANPINIVNLMAAAGLIKSKSEGRRLIQQGGVRLDGDKVSSIEIEIDVAADRVLQVGRRRYVRLVPGE